MESILKKHTIILGILITMILVLSGGYVFFFRMMKKRVQGVTEMKEKVALYQKNKNTFSHEVEEVKVLTEQIAALEKHVVTSETLPSILSSFEALALDEGVAFEITSVHMPVEDEKPKLIIEFNSGGSYDRVMSFLNSIQHQPFTIQFVKLFIFSDQGAADTLSTGVTKTTNAPKQREWKGVATVEIISF